jgi:hypothetical protein
MVTVFKLFPGGNLRMLCLVLKEVFCVSVLLRPPTARKYYVCWVVTVKMMSSAAKPKYVYFNMHDLS